MKVAKVQFLKIKKKYLNFLKKQEILGEPFYNKMQQLNSFYLPICGSIYKEYLNSKKTKIIGLSGGQGSGKSTIAKILKIILETKYNLNTIIFSIDDFYKTLKQRKIMGKKIHKLFLTRGVPGTHDMKILLSIIKKIKKKSFKPILIPKFDKTVDDRLPVYKWAKINKKPDIVIFEGWCVGSKARNNVTLLNPLNPLERNEDSKLTWRKKINNELKTSYKKIFKFIDKLIFLKVPSFHYVLKWRLLQEKKLRLKFRNKKKIMNEKQIKKFVMHYERITKNMLTDLLKSNIVVEIDKKHRLSSIKFN